MMLSTDELCSAFANNVVLGTHTFLEWMANLNTTHGLSLIQGQGDKISATQAEFLDQ